MTNRSRLRGADDRLLRGYGPLAGLCTLFLAMVLLAPTVAPEQLVAGGSTGGGSSAPAAPGGQPARGGLADPTDAVGVPTAAAVGVPPGAACPGYQVPDDPYSPPCAAWSGGDNGGATTRGVTADTISITLRDAGLPDLGSLIAQFSGVNDYVSSNEELVRTTEVLVDYFNEHYELYGRRLTLDVFRGQGNMLEEFLGGGRAGAQADAIAVAQEHRAFASLGAITQPYADALASNGVIALDNIFMSRDWAAQRAPYAWNIWPDCTKQAEIAGELVTRQLVGGVARYAGADLTGTARKFAIVAPDSVTFQPCLAILQRALDAAGVSARTVTYALDLGTIQNSGQQIASTLSEDGVTTVLLMTDPATPFFLSSGAQSIRWFPEWVVLGQYGLDADYLAQILPREQWVHAFGFSFSGQYQPPRANAAYFAFKQQSPDTEPAILLLPAIYAELRMLAIGIQLAGPNLTPETFAQGLRSYQSIPEQGSLGPEGTWGFPEGDFSAPQDVRIVWFDGTATSPTNDRPGAYRDNGRRYRPGNLPSGQPPISPAGS